MGHFEKGYTTTNYTTTYSTTNLGQTLKCEHLAFGPVWTRYDPGTSLQNRRYFFAHDWTKPLLTHARNFESLYKKH